MFIVLPPLALLILPAVLQLRLNEAPDCRRCSVEVSIGRVFGDTAGPGELPPEIRAVRRDERGRMLIGGYLPEPPLLYDSLGQFLAKVGRRGRGPGELQAPVVTSLAGDTAWVVDGVNARVTGYLLAPVPETSPVPKPHSSDIRKWFQSTTGEGLSRLSRATTPLSPKRLFHGRRCWLFSGMR